MSERIRVCYKEAVCAGHTSGPDIIVTSPTSDKLGEQQETDEDARADAEQKKVSFQIHDYPDSDTDHQDGHKHSDGDEETRPYFTFSPVQGKQLVDAAHHAQADGANDPLRCFTLSVYIYLYIIYCLLVIMKM